MKILKLALAVSIIAFVSGAEAVLPPPPPLRCVSPVQNNTSTPLYWKVVNCDGASGIDSAPSNPIPTGGGQEFKVGVPFGAQGCDIAVSADSQFTHFCEVRLFYQVFVIVADSGAGYQCAGDGKTFVINQTS